jgi:GR25 family glycosyltransferase involved in LPS biosynthesis
MRQHNFSNSLVLTYILVALLTYEWRDESHNDVSVRLHRIQKLRNTLNESITGLKTPDMLSVFKLGDGPWNYPEIKIGEWKKSSQCNPYSGRCSCLREWGLNLEECDEKSALTPVVLEASGWMTDWPYLPGLHRCKQSMCKVRHGHTSDSQTHARLFSVIDASSEKANANGAIAVVVAMESRRNYPLHGTLEFKYFFDLGVSYHNQVDIQVSYNNYLPKDFFSIGAPFDQKRNSLLFMHSNCVSKHRNKLFDLISPLIKVDALGPCKRNGDVATTLPQCAGLPRSGETVWSESECLLHHYKFYLAIENTIDEDYVTEMLYQGLRAGSVPIYFGAPNIRDFLPHPDSALLIEDFDNIDALIDYVKRASADELVYAKHMAWKSRKFPDQFINRVATNPMDSIFCKTCDLIATKYGDGVGPIAGGKGDGLLLPWCIIRSLTANSDAIIRRWYQPDAFKSSYSNLQTYVLSVKESRDRQSFIRQQLTEAQLQADLVIGFDQDEIDSNVFACWRPNNTLSSLSRQTALGPRVLSLAIKHIIAIWDMWQNGLEVALVLEDDVELASTFSQDVLSSLEEVPLNWDMITVGTCFNLHSTDESRRVSQRLYRPISSNLATRCTHAILWSYNGARKLLASLPIRWAIDFHINAVAGEADWESYWMEPALALQSEALPSLLQSERDGKT